MHFASQQANCLKTTCCICERASERAAGVCESVCCVRLEAARWWAVGLGGRGWRGAAAGAAGGARAPQQAARFYHIGKSWRLSGCQLCRLRMQLVAVFHLGHSPENYSLLPRTDADAPIIWTQRFLVRYSLETEHFKMHQLCVLSRLQAEKRYEPIRAEIFESSGSVTALASIFPIKLIQVNKNFCIVSVMW